MLFLPEIAEGEDKSSPFMNCLRKNYRHLRKWAKRTETDCFRIFDRDMHHYPIAVDHYAGHFCIQFFSTTRATQEPTAYFIQEVESCLKKLFGLGCKRIFWKIRAKRKETRQYEKYGASKEFFVVYENGIQFKVNLHDYLDTGLFLDHRETRKMVGTLSKDKNVLNLFAYTCSFSVYAAIGGARFTKSVDLSNTYTEWGKDNLKLNGFSFMNNQVIREDCLKFLKEEKLTGMTYDLIVIDPPTISRSKKLQEIFDIQQEYQTLISLSLEMLAKDGVIFFSTNSRKFTFDTTLFPNCNLLDISAKTFPIDFRDPKIHRCWKISFK